MSSEADSDIDFLALEAALEAWMHGTVNRVEYKAALLKALYVETGDVLVIRKTARLAERERILALLRTKAEEYDVLADQAWDTGSRALSDLYEEMFAVLEDMRFAIKKLPELGDEA